VSVSDGNGGGTGTVTERRPFGVVVASAIDGFRTLARKHVELARLEVTEAASIRGRGVGMMIGAAVVGMYAVGFVAAAGAAALALVVPTWAAILIVAAVLIVVAGVLVLVGRRALRTAPSPGERTQETLKEDARWAKQQIAR
jgi:MFS family permease